MADSLTLERKATILSTGRNRLIHPILSSSANLPYHCAWDRLSRYWVSFTTLSPKYRKKKWSLSMITRWSKRNVKCGVTITRTILIISIFWAIKQEQGQLVFLIIIIVVIAYRKFLLCLSRNTSSTSIYVYKSERMESTRSLPHI